MHIKLPTAFLVAGTVALALLAPTVHAKGKSLDVSAAMAVVGEVWITAPAGAIAYSLSSVALPPGGPPSVLVKAFATDVDVGLLGVQFTPDPAVAGDYEIAISMKGGNETTLHVTVND